MTMRVLPDTNRRFGSHQSFLLGQIPMFYFWLCLPRVSKLGWIPNLFASSPVCNGFFRFTCWPLDSQHGGQAFFWSTYFHTCTSLMGPDFIQLFFTVCNSSYGKVMFLQVSVCPQGERCTPPSRPPPDRHNPGQTPPHPLRWPLQLTVRILLECILVVFV